MRVAYVCADAGVPVFGRKGASVHVQEIVRALRARGAEVDLLAARLGGEKPPDLAGVRVFSLPGSRPEGTSTAREQAAQAAGGRAGAILDRLDKVDLVYERYSLWGSAAMRWAAQRGIPGILEVNAPLPLEQARYRVLNDRRAADEVAGIAIGAASAVIAVSEPVARWASEVAGPRAANSVHVVPNGVDVDRIRPVHHSPRSGPRRGETFTVGFIGTLKPWHGLPTLAGAFERLVSEDPSYRLLVVGDGPERAALLERIGHANGRVELAGSVDPTDVPALLHRMDVGVAPYPAAAGYFSPLKLFDYLAAGLPVVASAVGQLPQIIHHGRTGLLCPPDDEHALAAAIALVRGNRELASALGRAGRDLVERHHTWNAVVHRILTLAGIAQGASTR